MRNFQDDFINAKTYVQEHLALPPGEPIQREQLFEYTNGRFLVNEKHEMSRRYAKFDLDALCTLVSSLPSISSPISKIEKMEGGFNKALLMTAENGKEVIAKIPCPNVVPSKYSTASEVATLEYVKSHTSIPVSKVLAWSCDALNPVGIEYIVMEKAKGRQLVEAWGEMDQPQKFKVIQNLVRLESQLASVKFPDDVYCIGPVYNASWFPQFNNKNHDGPWDNLCDLGLALANRGLEHVQHSTLVPRGPHYGSKDEHIQTLETALKIIPILAGYTPLQRFSTPTLWHDDLHLGNIFVCDKDPTNIVSIIDWQFMSIMPAFMQVQWPSFLCPPDDYEMGMVKPELPPDFDEMDSDEKAFAITERDKALLAKCYEAALAKNHLQSYLAFTRVDPAIRHLFTFCENTSKDGIIPLRDSLVQISENWGQMGLPHNCPCQLSKDELSKHTFELARYKDGHKLKSYTQELLHSDDDGWVPPHLDFDMVKARHAELFQLYIQKETAELPEEEAKKLWFYIDRE
ncbi:hypothetical protein CDV55_106457 [Aspergillus turcosus]|nr:hypothetical protein CDV55_106457 [Aspergillus turcosus]